jgi:hypothetical protein
METDSLQVIAQVIDKIPYSYWAHQEPWRIVLMCIAVFNLHGIEPIVLILCWRFPKFTDWLRNLVEDSDQKPNLKDGLIMVMIILILWSGRGIVLAGIWSVVFNEDHIGVMGSLGGFIIALLGSAVLANRQL